MQEIQLPSKFKFIGIFLMAIGLAGLIANFFGFEPAWMNWSMVSLWQKDQPNTLTLIDHNMYARVCATFYLIGSAFVIFAREKKNPEKYTRIWFTSLIHAYGVAMLLMLIGIFVIPGFSDSLTLLVVPNMAVPVIYIILFHMRKQKMLNDEKEQVMALEQFRV